MKRILALLLVGVMAILAKNGRKENPPLPARYIVVPWQAGSANDALVQSATLTSIPMAGYSIAATKDSTAHTGVLVGRSPFDRGKALNTVSVKLIPIVVTIGSTVFDPTAIDSCTAGGTHTTVDLLQNSPLFMASSLSMNGVSLGTRQYIDGFRAAEFWSLVSGSGYGTSLDVTTLSAYNLTSVTIGTHGIINGSGCGTLGVLANGWLDGLIQSTIMPSYGSQIAPTDFAFFFFRNVVQSGADPPTISNCCILGYHGATGTPVQTYGTADYESSGRFGSGSADISVAVHEVAEWLDDPLGTNPTPAWGKIGQVAGCQGNLEVGDPLSGTLAPGITMLNGVTYHPQELAFFSWFFNSHGTASLGAGSAFSSNGTFAGPSKNCPSPGGTF